MNNGYIRLSDKLADKLALLPEQPGCYIMKDKDNNILYIGKAKVLKNRVRSYFQKSADLTRRKRKMVFQIEDFETIIVNTEREAFILENNLIKKYSPPYNVMLKDGKSYPYIVVTLSEEYPRVIIRHKLHRSKSDKDKYFGPYTNAQAVKETVKLIRKVFHIPCGFKEPNKAKRGCLYWHIGQCIGVCAGKATKSDYLQAVNDVIAFLNGSRKELLNKLENRMMQASERLEFEEAAQYRNQITAIKKLAGSQNIIGEDFVDRDILALAINERCSVVNIMQIRQNSLIGQNCLELKNTDEESPEDTLSEFIKVYYSEQEFVPKEIIVNYFPGPESEEMLSNLRGSKVSIIIPVKGHKKEMLLMAEKNVKEQLTGITEKILKSEVYNTECLAELAGAINMEYLPSRMECYDISHIQGTNTVASLVTFTDGVPDKSKYRHFKINSTEGKPDDFTSMKEVIDRRINGSLRKSESFRELPDLLIIDGGKGQLSSVLEILKDNKCEDINIISIAKRDEIIFLKDMTPIVLPKESKGLMLVQRIRDEAHRFAITHHRKLRAKALTGSSLSKIPGIGPKKQKELLNYFQSIENIANADVKQLMKVSGISSVYAQRIYNFYHT